MVLTQCLKLDVRLALVFQQATLVKLSETYSRLESATTTQGLDASNQLVLMQKIKVAHYDTL